MNISEQTNFNWTPLFDFEYAIVNNKTSVRLNHYDEGFRELARQKRAIWNPLIKAWTFKQSIEELTPHLEKIQNFNINEIQKNNTNQKKTIKLIQHIYGNDNNSYLFKHDKISISFIIKENIFKLQFPYNYELIEFVKKMRGARFDFENKTWNIPHKYFKDIHSLSLSLIRANKIVQKNTEECSFKENEKPLFEIHPALKSLFHNIYLNKNNNHYVFEGFCQFESSEFNFYDSFVNDYLIQENQIINKNYSHKIPNFITQLFKPSISLPHNPLPYTSFPATNRELLEKSLTKFAEEHQESLSELTPLSFSFLKSVKLNGFKMKSVAASCIYINKNTYECFYIYKINHIKKTPKQIYYEASALPISPAEAQKKILNNRAIFEKTAIISSIELDSMEKILEGAIIADKVYKPAQKLNKSIRL